MSRLLATVQCDFRLQFRNGFYYASAFVAAVSVLLLRLLPEQSLAWVLPVGLFGNIQINAFYFIGGLILLEKREGTLEVQIVTPLQTQEYLASKLITLTLLSLAEGIAIVVLTFGFSVNIVSLAMGITLMSVFFCLCGFMVVARYDSINEYLFPSILYILILSLPLIHYFEIWQSWLFYLHPIQASLILLQAAFRQVEAWEIVYGIVYSILWIGFVFVLSQRTFHRFVITKEGIR